MNTDANALLHSTVTFTEAATGSTFTGLVIDVDVCTRTVTGTWTNVATGRKVTTSIPMRLLGV
jgi:hypothetical protein